MMFKKMASFERERFRQFVTVGVVNLFASGLPKPFDMEAYERVKEFVFKRLVQCGYADRRTLQHWGVNVTINQQGSYMIVNIVPPPEIECEINFEA